MKTIRHCTLLFCSSLLLLLVAAPIHAECTADPWKSTISYVRGNTVLHQLHEWSAKRSSQDVPPGTHKPTWRDLGQCDSGEEPPPPPQPGDATPIQIFGLWHAGNNYADWSIPREFDEFDAANHWIIDRGDGQGAIDPNPSVNLVVLSFVHPMRLLDWWLDGADPLEDAVPVGMSQMVVDYFKNESIRVMMSIGGVTYTDAWDEALEFRPWELGLAAAKVATEFDVGIEIDYERNTDPNLIGLEQFILAYRSVHPYDPTGANHAARLTIDLAAGGRYLQDLNRYATIHWLDNADLVDDVDYDPYGAILDYANAMVHRSSGSPANWQEHVDGKPTYDPPIPPKAPNRFTGGLYLKGNMDNCTDFYGSEQFEHAEYVQTVAPNDAGLSAGMLGYMFWAAEIPSARKNYVPTTPPNGCEDGMGEAANVFDLPIPMEALRQE